MLRFTTQIVYVIWILLSKGQYQLTPPSVLEQPKPRDIWSLQDSDSGIQTEEWAFVITRGSGRNAFCVVSLTEHYLTRLRCNQLLANVTTVNINTVVQSPVNNWYFSQNTQEKKSSNLEFYAMPIGEYLQCFGGAFCLYLDDPACSAARNLLVHLDDNVNVGKYLQIGTTPCL